MRQNGPNTRPSDNRTAEVDFVVAKLINQIGTAEGTSLPPRQSGATRVPIVANFRVLSAVSYNGGTEFTVGFDNPPLVSNLSCFRIYTKLQNDPGFSSSTTCQQSPAKFRVATLAAQSVTFICQTVLKGGFQSDISESPSCTGKTIDGSLSRAGLLAGIAPIQTVSFVPGDLMTYPCYNAGGAFNVDLPDAALNLGRVYVFKKVDPFGTNVTLNAFAGQSIDGAAMRIINVPYQSVMIQSDGGVNWYTI